MERKNKRKKRNWLTAFKSSTQRNRPRWQMWTAIVLVVLLLYALLKVIASKTSFFGMWLSTFLDTVEGIFLYLSGTILSPVGLILITFIWLIKSGDLYQFLNKIRYLRLAKGDAPVVQLSGTHDAANREPFTPLNAWQRSLLGEIERTSNIEEQQKKLSQLVVYEQLSKKPAILPLLQFLHYYRRDDISFYQVAQFLAGEGLLDKDRLSNQELDIESAVLGYMSYLQHTGLVEVHMTLQPSPDGFYGTIHKVKIPQHVHEVMELFSD